MTTLDSQIEQLITTYEPANYGNPSKDHIRNWALGLKSMRNDVANGKIQKHHLKEHWNETVTPETNTVPADPLAYHGHNKKSHYQSFIDRETDPTLQAMMTDIHHQIHTWINN